MEHLANQPEPLCPARACPWARGGLLLGLLALFSLTLWAGLWRNDFPSAWHNDEPGKIRQIRQGARNLHHPPLLLDLTAAACRLQGVPSASAHADPERIAQVGRGLSALFLALAAVGASLLTYRLARVPPGRPAGVSTGAALTTGALLASEPLLIECAHYFKEDILHLLGLVVALLAGQYFWEGRSSLPRAVLAGAALALCVSAKHSGWLLPAIMLPVSVWLLWRGGPSLDRPRTQLLPLGAAFAVFYGLLNWQLLIALPMALGELGWELRKLGGGDYGVGEATPHLLYFWWLYNEYGLLTGLLLLVLLGFGLRWLVQAPSPRRRDAAVLWSHVWALHVLSALAAVYLLVLAFTAKFSDRYALPLCLCAAIALPLGALWLGHHLVQRTRLNPRWAPLLGLLALGLTVGPGRAVGLAERLEGFARDSRAELVQHIQHQLPGGSVIAADSMALGTAEPALGGEHAALSTWFAADLGTLPDLARQGVTHIAFSRDVAHRYFETPWALRTYAGGVAGAGAGARPLDLHRVRFYSALAQAVRSPTGTWTGEGLTLRLVWQGPHHHPRPLHPGLYLVEIQLLPE